MNTQSITSVKSFYSQFPTVETMKAKIEGLKGQIANYRKSMQQRMENYFNCIDDYSYGGICDQACNEAINSCQRVIDSLEHQLVSGSVIEEYNVNMLYDLQGNLVSEKIVNGAYGACWIISNGVDQETLEKRVSFVGLAKKQATYNKKGYQLMTKTLKVEYYYTTKIGKNGLITEGRVLSETITPTENLEYTTTQLPTPAYFATLNMN